MADWSREEVEATVSDYLAMLHSEISGLIYNKSEHRRRLSRLLSGRTDGAIERKHQNISAILIELEYPYVAGYKPLANYQSLLRRVVVERLRAATDLIAAISEDVTAPESGTPEESNESARVDPPDPWRAHERVADGPLEDLASQRLPVPSYLERESMNTALGTAGERFVLELEEARLRACGRRDLAERVEHVAETRGPRAGFDVLSFEASGAEKWIEVKTTRYGIYTPFFISRHEVDVSSRAADRYHLYRVFDFRRDTRYFSLPGSVSANFRLDAHQYRASVA